MDINEYELNSCFNYRVYTNEELDFDVIDWDKLQYNYLYHSYQFYENKFPKGYESIAGFDKIIENIANISMNNSPLLELENILSTSNNITNE